MESGIDTLLQTCSQSIFSSADESLNAPAEARLFVANESITMPKLHSVMRANEGSYLSIMDEIEGLFKSLDSCGGPDYKDRRTWLSLHTGMSWARSTSAGRKSVENTRLNYTGTAIF